MLFTTLQFGLFLAVMLLLFYLLPKAARRYLLLAGSLYQAGPDECLCARCSTARGERTREAFDAVEKPDYSVLLKPSFWWRPAPTAEALAK